MKSDSEAGYRRPPVASQFKKGVSGNPSGRPKKVAPFFEEAKAILERPVSTTAQGRRRTMSMGTAVLRRTSTRALQGDAAAMKRMIDLMVELEKAKQAKDDNNAAIHADLLRTWAKLKLHDLVEAFPTPESLLELGSRSRDG